MFGKATEPKHFFVPFDLIEKHKLLMDAEALEHWPGSERIPELSRLRRT